MRGKKGKNPPFLSQEFIIQNHGDIVSCVCMVIMVALMFQATQPLAQVFIAAQYNITTGDEGAKTISYTYGWKDLATVFFYSLCWIVLHAIIQEYILDKFNKRLHMSKTKHSKFNDSGTMLPFYVASIGFAIDQIQKLEIMSNFSRLWEGYPPNEMSFMVKFYFILQIAYWLHCFPELYFMKTKKEEIMDKVNVYGWHLVFITGAYLSSGTHIALILLVIHYIPEAIFNLTRLIDCAGKADFAQHGFLLWAISFVLARIATISLTILIIWFGLGKHDIGKIDVASGNLNSQTVRIAWVAAIVLVQAWMAWNFIMLQVQKYRESLPTKSSKVDKTEKSKKKKEKTEENGGGSPTNRTSPRTSPRAKKND